MSLARRHRDRILAGQTAAAAPHGGEANTPAAVPPPTAAGVTPAVSGGASAADRAAAQIALRFTHDLRRLKEIKSVALKIDAKRQMLPEYKDWVQGLLEADAGVGSGTAAEILPTYMVWLIDIGEYAAALDLVPFILRHDVQMPKRYERDAATIVVEEISEAALKVQATGDRFPIETLFQVHSLTIGIDMHDQVKAKLHKAIGVELLADVEEMEASEAARQFIEGARNTLRSAQALHDRVGVKDKIRRAEKLLAANLAAFPPATDESANTETTEQDGSEAV